MGFFYVSDENVKRVLSDNDEGRSDRKKEEHKCMLRSLLSFSFTAASHLSLGEWWLRIPGIFAAAEPHE